MHNPNTDPDSSAANLIKAIDTAQTLVEKEAKFKGFSWCLRNKGKIFHFKTKRAEKIARIVGFAEDIAAGYFIVTTADEIEGQRDIIVSNAALTELPKEALAEMEKCIPKAKTFFYHIFGPEHNADYYNMAVLTPIGREATR